MQYNKRDIIVVDFPFSDLKDIKKRPALILFNTKGNNYILAQITSRKSKIKDYEISILKNEMGTNLNINSYIKIDMIFTLNKNLIYGKIGSIPNNIYEKVESKFMNYFKT